MLFSLHDFAAIGILQNVYPLGFATQGHKPQTLRSFALPSVFAVPIWLGKLLNFSPNLLRLLLFIFIRRILYMLANVAYT